MNGKPSLRGIRGALVVALTLCIAHSVTQADPRSGYHYIKPETREMQDDDFANPGLAAVERGESVFHRQPDNGHKACAACHGEGGGDLKPGRIAAYPVYSPDSGSIISLQARIAACREDRQGAAPLPVNHPDLLDLETFVRHLAVGEPVRIATEGEPIKRILKKGEELYRTQYGLIDMSCYHCHTVYPGQWIRGQKISEGRANGFPAYRLATGEITNLNMRITQCLTLMRAEPFPPDSDEIKLLEYYLSARSNGLPIETPAVRY
ncbi:MAG: sulfur oxidation c-type cytochrome SoxA [Gammaproteobacteria bacterium]